MARPRQFDESAVLDRALAVFWDKGYQATSFDDLVHATGLGRGSLTAAFGDKDRLFGAVLDHYIRQRAQTVADMDEPPSAKARLEVLLHGWIGMTNPAAGPCGCFLALSGVSGDAPAFARDRLAASLQTVRAMLAELIRHGQARGELHRGGTPDALADFCVVLLQGIAMTARVGWDAATLHGVVAQALAHIVGPPPKRRAAVARRA